MNIKFNFNIDVDVNIETEEIKAVTDLLSSLDKKDLADIMTKGNHIKRDLMNLQRDGERINRNINRLNSEIRDIKQLALKKTDCDINRSNTKKY